MESYPQFLLKDLRPLVFITGAVEDESDLHARLTANLEKCNTEIDQRDFPPLSYKSVSIDHAYVLKKNPKEYQSVDGILKYSSLQKHYDLLPSVVVLVVSFSVEWQASEWAQLNETLFEKISRHRDQMKGRDSRVFLIAVRTGTAQISQEVIEEKMGNMRRYLSLDNNRTFVAIALSDISAQPPNSTMRRISKSIRELSYAYYNVLEKRARFLLKTARIRGSNEGILTARYSFKLAYFLSFQGLKLQSLKYYRQCFDALIGIVYHVEEDLVDQLKTVAEFTHYKICSMFLQSGSVRDAIAQFMTHVTSFSKVYSALAWKHYAWICDQHVVFLQLLDLYKVSNDLLTNETVDRYFFLQNALRFAIKRQQDFAKSVGGSSDVDVAEKRSRSHLLSLIVSPAKYVGAMPVLIDPVLGPDLAHTTLSLTDFNNSDTKLTIRYLTETERAVDVSGFIFRLFQRSEDYLRSCSAKFTRRKANLNALLAEQLVVAGRYEQALDVLTQIVDYYRDEGWVEPSITLLRRIASCCIVLGRPEQYLAAAITLYSQGGRAFEGAEGGERERLNSDILSLIDCDLPFKLLPPSTIKHDPSGLALTEWPVHNPENKSATSKTSPNDPPVLSKMNSFSASDTSAHLYRKLHYGWAASPERPAAISLPLRTVVVMNGRKGSIFDIHAEYSQPDVEIGNSVTVSLTIKSKLLNTLIVDEIYVSFTGEKLFKRLVHPRGTLGGGGMGSLGSAKSPGSPQGKRGVSPPSKARGPCCPHYCSSYAGALKGNRLVTAHTDSSIGSGSGSSSDVSYACLSLPPGQAVTYSFPLLTQETILPSLPSNDPSVCLDTVYMTIRTPITPVLPTELFSSLTPELGAGQLEDSSGIETQVPLKVVSPPDEIDLYREVVLEISPLSAVFRAALQDRMGRKDEKGVVIQTSGKQVYTLYDLRAFLGSHRSPKVLQLTRPLALLELIHPPSPPGQPTVIIEKKMSTSGKVPAPPPPAGPIPVAKLLQGPVQRLDLIFKAGENHILNGRIYLSSDYSPTSSSSALFWCPDVEPLITADQGTEATGAGAGTGTRSSYVLDTVAYHPIFLNSSYQPSQPLLLPTILPNSVYCVPLFLRSEIQGSYKLRLFTEFIPKIGHTATVSKEVELTVTFLKPLNMNFSLSSEREAQCGVVREGFMSTVLEGDVVNMSASLGCANALGGEIQVLGMTFLQSPPVAQSDDYYDDTGNINDNDNDGGESPSKKTVPPSLFRLSNGDTTINLLHPADTADSVAAIPPIEVGGVKPVGGDKVASTALDSTIEGKGATDGTSDSGLPPLRSPDGIAARAGGNALSALGATPTANTVSSVNDVLLKKGEVYVCSTDILCVESLQAPTLPFTAQVASMGDLYVDWRLQNDQILSPPDLSPWRKASEISTVMPVDHTNFDWLLQWGSTSNIQTDNPEDTKQAIDKRTSTTRVCGMVFSVPRVKISPSPFTVSITLSSSCRKNEILPLEILIKNKLWSSENLTLTVDTAASSSGPPGSPGTSSSSAPGAKELGSDSSVCSGSCGFLVVGNTSSLLNVSPKGFCTISLSLVPIQTGFLCLPHICVTWERSNAVVVELSTHSVPKYIFVRP